MTTQTDDDKTALVGVLTSMFRVDIMILVVWSMSLLYIVVQDRADRQREISDRQQAELRHQEVMESIRAVPGAMVQQVRVEQRNGLQEDLTERFLKGGFNADNVRGVDSGSDMVPSGDNGR